MPALRWSALVALVACGQPQSSHPQPPVAEVKPPVAAPPAPPTPPDLRLPTTVLPTHNVVDLTIDPSTQVFKGKIVTELDVKTPTRVLWLNAHEITVDDAEVTVGGAKIAATASTPKPEYLGLQFAKELPAGKATLEIEYHGKMPKDDGQGIYTAQEDGAWYAFTQFEATDARRAFPTFDEPSFKVPWQLTIHTKKDLVAVSNTPVAAETDEAGGMKAVKFAETKPLPSYLVAFAVGPFEFLDAGKTRAGAPIRIVVPKGRTGDAGYPVKATKRIVDALEDYFGSPYPWDKLDMLAVSVFNAGAMENPGLITYRQEIILTKPAEMTLSKQRVYTEVAAHELAHQWFGDKVTLAWWDDTWLNESFAEWMGEKVTGVLEPTWDKEVDAIGSKSRVMVSDSLETARQIRQPIQTANDIRNAFDGITYQKGQAVLTMIERWLGPDVFKQGVRDYMAKHAFANATYDDFVSAMSGAAGKDVKPLFDAFVKQTGVPVVSVELRCDKDAAPKLALEQKRYAPMGSKIDAKRTWPLPVCAKWGVGEKTGRDCVQLEGATGELPLSAKTCPDWVLPNEGSIGYYRMQPKGELLPHLLKAARRQLSVAERVGLIGDVEALVLSGDVQSGVALQLVADLAQDKNHYIVDASVGIVAGIDEMVPDALRANYERFIKKQYQVRAHELGFVTRKTDDENTKQLRPVLLALVAGIGKDKELVTQATALAWKYLDDHKAVDPELAGTVLAIAARYGDQKLYDRLHADAKKATDRQDRTRLLGAMGSFIDPKLTDQALMLMLSDEFELREAVGLLQGSFQQPRTRLTAYKWVEDHYDAIQAKMPPMYRPYMAFTVLALCGTDRRAEGEAFFKPRIEKLDGGPRIMAQMLEQLDLCTVQKKAQTPGVEAFLKKQ